MDQSSCAANEPLGTGTRNGYFSLRSTKNCMTALNTLDFRVPPMPPRYIRNGLSFQDGQLADRLHGRRVWVFVARKGSADSRVVGSVSALEASMLCTFTRRRPCNVHGCSRGRFPESACGPYHQGSVCFSGRPAEGDSGATAMPPSSD